MKNLFRTAEELKTQLPATANFTLGQLMPHLVRAQQRYIREALGYEQLDELVTALYAATAEAPLSEDLTNLLDQVRPALASLAAAYYLPGGTVQLTGTGTKTSQSENLKPATAQEKRDLADSLEASGYDSLEALLEFLEENRASYPKWASSEACTIQAAALLNSAAQLNRFVFIDRSRRRFIELQPALRDVEHLALRPVMGDELLAELHTQLAAGSSTTANILLLSYVRPALANLAFRDDELRQSIGRTYLDELRSFLYDRAEDYPLFKASSAYKPDVATQLTQDPDWGFFAAM